MTPIHFWIDIQIIHDLEHRNVNLNNELQRTELLKANNAFLTRLHSAWMDAST